MQHKHGGDIYSYKTIKDFSANINFRGMPEAVRTAASAAIASSVHYPDPEYRKLREALAERENQLLKRQKGMQCGTVLPQHLICGNGAAELMFALASAVSPRRALLAVPSFFEYEQALASVGCEIDRFRLHEEDQFGVRDDFLNEIGKETDIIILGNPNNPTGRLLEKEFLEKLRQVCGRRGILLVLDESFSDFLCAQDQMRTCHGAEWAIQEKNVFVIRSFTKMYAMPGLRFGYGICSDTVLLERMHLRLQPWNVSVPAQAAAEAAARELHFAEETALQTRCNRTEMQRQMEEAGYRVISSDANFLLFLGPRHLQEFCVRHGFLIRDCSNFPGLECEDGCWYRICVRSSEENRELLEVLREAAGSQAVRNNWKSR